MSVALRAWIALGAALCGLGSLVVLREPANVRALRSGTLAVRRARPADAIAELERAARTDDPSLRARALHNLALAHLLLAERARPADAEAHARASITAARDALRIDASATATRWNLALAERMLPPPEVRTPDPAPRDALDGATVGEAGLDPGPLTTEEATRTLDALRSTQLHDALATLPGRVGRRSLGGLDR